MLTVIFAIKKKKKIINTCIATSLFDLRIKGDSSFDYCFIHYTFEIQLYIKIEVRCNH